MWCHRLELESRYVNAVAMRPMNQRKRDCSKDTGLSHHAALALCRILVV